jgi:hypothetical protein
MGRGAWSRGYRAVDREYGAQGIERWAQWIGFRSHELEVVVVQEKSKG